MAIDEFLEYGEGVPALITYFVAVGAAVYVGATVTDGKDSFAAGQVNGVKVELVTDNKSGSILLQHASSARLDFVDAESGKVLPDSTYGAVDGRTLLIRDPTDQDGACTPTSFRFKLVDGEMKVTKVSTEKALGQASEPSISAICL